MAVRKPLIVSAGTLKELPAGDTLDPLTLATGTPDGTQFLRDDGTWATPAGGGAAGPSLGLIAAGQLYGLSFI